MCRPFEFALDLATGVPVYRQLIDQILAARATGRLAGGDRLPTVRQVAVNLSINPNTVQKAYRELEIRGVLTTQQGTGTFLTVEKVAIDEVQRRQRLDQLAAEFVARAGSEGYNLAELLNVLTEFERGNSSRF